MSLVHETTGLAFMTPSWGEESRPSNARTQQEALQDICQEYGALGYPVDAIETDVMDDGNLLLQVYACGSKRPLNLVLKI